MADEIQLEVVTPDRRVLRRSVSMVAAPGIMGEFGVLPGHIPFMTPLGTGILAYKTSDGADALVVSQGFAEVNGNTVTILAERADLLTEIDPQKAQEELRQLEERIKGKGMLDEDFAKLRADVDRAAAKILLAKKN